MIHNDLKHSLIISEPTEIDLGGGVVQTDYREVRKVFASIEQKSSSFGINQGVQSEVVTYKIKVRRPIAVDRGNGQEQLNLNTSHRLGFWGREFRIFAVDITDLRFYKIQAIELLNA